MGERSRRRNEQGEREDDDDGLFISQLFPASYCYCISCYSVYMAGFGIHMTIIFYLTIPFLFSPAMHAHTHTAPEHYVAVSWSRGKSKLSKRGTQSPVKLPIQSMTLIHSYNFLCSPPPHYRRIYLVKPSGWMCNEPVFCPVIILTYLRLKIVYHDMTIFSLIFR